MPGALDHFLLVVLVVLLPVGAAFIWYPRLKRLLAANVPGARRAAYRSTILSEWVLVAATALLWWRAGRPFAELGLAAPQGWRFAAGAAVVLAAVVLLAAQFRQVRRDPAARARVLTQLGSVELLLPHTPDELREFLRLSLTAGLCEELLYRGFVLWYLAQYAGLAAAVVLSSGFFGLAHFYQSPRNGARAAALGLGFAALYVFTGSLWLPMLLHTAIDIYGGRVGFTALQAGES